MILMVTLFALAGLFAVLHIKIAANFLIYSSLVSLVAYMYASLPGRLNWSPEGIVIAEPLRKRRIYQWDQVESVRQKLSSTSKRHFQESETLITFQDHTAFKFDLHRNKSQTLAFAVSLGRILPETESTEMAKPATPVDFDERMIQGRIKGLKKMVSVLAFWFVFSIVFLAIVKPVDFLMYFFPFAVILPLLVSTYIDATHQAVTLRAWRENPAFTDPDRTIELLMYDQYGDLAEPLGRFYRHVWANDAKRNQPNLP